MTLTIGAVEQWRPEELTAGTRYAIDRYGSLSNVPGVVGVSTGTGYVGY